MSLLSLLIDAFFPHICCHCKKIGTVLCEKCYSQLEFFINDSDEKDPIKACTKFGEVSSSIVHTLKYDSVKDLGLVCARIMYMSCVFPEVDIITAVPLHKKRQRQRGFNQAEVIAKELGRLLDIEYQPLLLRTKETINFAKVRDKDKRAELSNNLFEVNPDSKDLIASKSILIIDDVWTTGATLEACAEVLKASDVTHVAKITFSHGI